ncbi:MAG: ferrochelatase [Candidatus Dormibacteria bacterium]
MVANGSGAIVGNRTGVLLMTFGSAVTADDVPAYLSSVRGGRAVADELVAEFQTRYRRIGRSPLIEITLEQAAALQGLLDVEDGARCYLVRAGMLHSEPRIARVIDELVAGGAAHIIAVVLSPQFSPIILAGYERALTAAREAHPDVGIVRAGAWHMEPEWIESLATRVQEALATLPAETPLIFTAHSLPKAVVDRDPAYIEQLRDTARAVALQLGLAAGLWQFAYQSAGHTPEPWLTPDVKDLLPEMRERGVRTVLVVPVQFLTDHLELLYDIDIAAVDEAREHGIEMRRIAMPNAAPDLIRALAAVVHREAAAQPRKYQAAERRY